MGDRIMDDFWTLIFLVLYIIVVIGLIVSGVNVLMAIFWPLVVMVVLAILAFAI